MSKIKSFDYLNLPCEEERAALLSALDEYSKARDREGRIGIDKYEDWIDEISNLVRTLPYGDSTHRECRLKPGEDNFDLYFPEKIEVEDQERWITAYYRCKCGYMWRCWWSILPIDK